MAALWNNQPYGSQVQIGNELGWVDDEGVAEKVATMGSADMGSLLFYMALSPDTRPNIYYPNRASFERIQIAATVTEVPFQRYVETVAAAHGLTQEQLLGDPANDDEED